MDNTEANEALVSIIERIERAEEEKADIATVISAIYSESKALGYDPKIIRKIVSQRKKNPAELEEEEAMLQRYKEALGMG